MTGNGRAAMRPGGRSPPFLIIGLVVGLCIIGFNYYKVSSRNSELSQEIPLLRGRIKSLTTEKMELQQSNYEVLQACKQKNVHLEESKSNMEKEVKEAQDHARSFEDQVTSCKTEVETHKTNFNKCDQDLNGIQQELVKVKGELEEAKKAQADASSVTVTCDQSACAEHIGNVVAILIKSVGKQSVLAALQQNGIDISKFGNIEESEKSPDAKQPAETNPQSGANAQAGANPQEGANAQVGANPQAGANTQAAANPQAGANTQAAANPQAGANTQAAANPQVGANPQEGAGQPGNQSANADIKPADKQESDKGKSEEEHKEKGLTGDGFPSAPSFTLNRGNSDLHQSLTSSLPDSRLGGMSPDLPNDPQNKDSGLQHAADPDSRLMFDHRFKPNEFLGKNQYGNSNENQFHQPRPFDTSNQQKSELEYNMANELDRQNNAQSNEMNRNINVPANEVIQHNNVQASELDEHNNILANELDQHNNIPANERGEHDNVPANQFEIKKYNVSGQMVPPLRLEGNGGRSELDSKHYDLVMHEDNTDVVENNEEERDERDKVDEGKNLKEDEDAIDRLNKNMEKNH